MDKANVPKKELITKLCKKIENEEKIKILFAVENGSRAWRMDSSDSDYDVRFVFHYPLERYISLNKPKDVISKYYDKEGKKHAAKGCFIDIVGFDIFKYLQLLASSNPTTIEWLKSDIVYYGKQNKVFQKFAFKYFKKSALFYHYKSLAEQNYKKYIESGANVSYKKYLYVTRGIANAKYVKENNKVPPIELKKVVKELKLPTKIKKTMLNLISLKRKGDEKQRTTRLKDFDDYIEKFIKKDIEKPKIDLKAQKILDKELKRILLNDKNE